MPTLVGELYFPSQLDASSDSRRRFADRRLDRAVLSLLDCGQFGSVWPWNSNAARQGRVNLQFFNVIRKIRSSQMSNGQNAKMPAVSWNLSCVKGLLQHCTRQAALPASKHRAHLSDSKLCDLFAYASFSWPSLFGSHPPRAIPCAHDRAAKPLPAQTFGEPH
jgi:hypothetical protein